MQQIAPSAPIANSTEFTVIVPAHNEEAVIRRCLETAISGAPAGHRTQLIVAANGCTDRTLAFAREAVPGIDILDLAQSSKTAAMNAANAIARPGPRIYLDADIRCDYRCLLALAAALGEPGAMAASPAIQMDLRRSGPVVAAYYRVWLSQPYVTCNMVGSGCYGLSVAAQLRLGDFPEVIGDDIWAHSRFSQSERRSVRKDAEGREVFFTVTPPRRASDQIRVETRRRLGNVEVRQKHPSAHYAGSNGPGDLMTALRNGANLSDLAIYLGIKLIVRARAGLMARLKRNIAWERDDLARQG